MRVELRIGRLVVHGAAEFDRDAFVRVLEQRIAGRLAQGADVVGVARRLGSGEAPAHGEATTFVSGEAVAETAARGVAARILR